MIGGETIAILKSQKLHATMKKAFVTLHRRISVHSEGDDFFFFETIMFKLYNTTMQEGVTFFLDTFMSTGP